MTSSRNALRRAGRGPIRVLIADDHAPTRADLREAVEQDERFTVVAE